MTRKTRWVKKGLELEREKRGNACMNIQCQSPEWFMVEFAHVQRTDCTAHGRERTRRGRGSAERYQDIRDNPSAYVLLCRECHCEFDKYGRELVLAVRSELASDGRE